MKASNQNIKAESILNRVDRRTGMSVPDGYFDDFVARMSKRIDDDVKQTPRLPDNVAPRSVWQRIRPYVYLAAMFAGVWCMMQVFGLTGSSPDLTVSSRPALAQAMEDPQFSAEYIYDVDPANEEELMDLLWQEGFNPIDMTASE